MYRSLPVLLVLGLLACGESAPPESSAAPSAQPAAAPESAPAPAAGEIRYDSGLRLLTLVAGTGTVPSRSDTVRVHYEGSFEDGRVFDSSLRRGQPAVFPLTRVIPCWTEALQHIQVGGKARLICPPEIAYGARGAPPTIPPNATLVFEVELLGIEGD